MSYGKFILWMPHRIKVVRDSFAHFQKALNPVFYYIIRLAWHSSPIFWREKRGSQGLFCQNGSPNDALCNTALLTGRYWTSGYSWLFISWDAHFAWSCWPLVYNENPWQLPPLQPSHVEILTPQMTHSKACVFSICYMIFDHVEGAQLHLLQLLQLQGYITDEARTRTVGVTDLNLALWPRNRSKTSIENSWLLLHTVDPGTGLGHHPGYTRYSTDEIMVILRGL